LYAWEVYNEGSHMGDVMPAVEDTMELTFFIMDDLILEETWMKEQT
jgi:hypothetical protein